MNEKNEVLNRDLAVLEVMVAELEEYLMSEATHWVMSRGDMPKLTIGGCLMRCHRLEKTQKKLVEEAQNRLTAVTQQFNRLVEGNVVRFERRVHQELRARLAQWAGYLSHMSSRPMADVNYYAGVVDTRVVMAAMVQRLEQQPFHLDPNIREELNTLDQNLQKRWQTGVFVWDDVWQPVYEAETYWYLYGRPK